MKNPEIDSEGNKWWYNKLGQVHRDDGPAIVCPNGYQSWWQNGKRHRLDGPAIIWTDGTEFWYINNKEIKPMPNIICLLRKKLKQ